MVTFARNEIVSSSQLVRNFATFLKQLTELKQEKIAIIKNNEMQAVMIPVEEYEKLKSIEEIAERKEIFDTVQSRSQTPESEYVSYDEAMKQAGF